jgi:hypothetical protein
LQIDVSINQRLGVRSQTTKSSATAQKNTILRQSDTKSGQLAQKENDSKRWYDVEKGKSTIEKRCPYKEIRYLQISRNEKDEKEKLGK